MPVIGGLLGAGVGFLLQAKMKKPASSSSSNTFTEQKLKLSAETKDMMEQLDGFKKLPEYHALFDAIGRLEQYEADVQNHPKKYSKSQVTSETSRYAARATRMLESLVAKNRHVNPLDMQSDAESIKKIINDLKYNLYQQAGLLSISSPS